MPVSARLAATERSMHLVRITAIWPSASMIRIEVSLKTLPRFAGVAKPGKRSAIRATSSDDGAGEQGLAGLEQAVEHQATSRDAGGGAHQLLGRQPVALEGADDPALAHDDDAVGHAEDLGDFGGDHDDGEALRRELGHELVHRGLGADVDALGRLVEDDDPRLRRQPLGDHHLLLVAARELADVLVERGGAQVEPRGVLAGQAELLGEPQEAAARGARRATAA